MKFMIPRGFLRYRDQNSSSGRKDRQQNICITTVIVTSHQHILMKNNGIIKKRAVLIRHDSMKDVELDQKDVKGERITTKDSFISFHFFNHLICSI